MSIIDPNSPCGLNIPGLDSEWTDVFSKIFATHPNQRDKLFDHLKQIENGSITVCPKLDDIFRCFVETPLDKVECVFLGMDPYTDIKYADGLCFSIRDPSIYKISANSFGPGMALNVLINERIRDGLTSRVRTKLQPAIQPNFLYNNQPSRWLSRQQVNQLINQFDISNINQGQSPLTSQQREQLEDRLRKLDIGQTSYFLASGLDNRLISHLECLNSLYELSAFFVNAISNVGQRSVASPAHLAPSSKLTPNKIVRLNTHPFTSINTMLNGSGQLYRFRFLNDELCKVVNQCATINQSTGRFYAQSGDLSGWAHNGVLLLNHFLTVQESMQYTGTNNYEDIWWWFTEEVVEKIAKEKGKNDSACAFIFFGSSWKQREFYESFEEKYSPNPKFLIRYFEHPSVHKYTSKNVMYSGIFSDIVAHLDFVNKKSGKHDIKTMFPIK